MTVIGPAGTREQEGPVMYSETNECVCVFVSKGDTMREEGRITGVK